MQDVCRPKNGTAPDGCARRRHGAGLWGSALTRERLQGNEWRCACTFDLRAFGELWTDVYVFTVVRNPYDRMLSWFNCPWTGYKGRERVTAKTLNLWLLRHLQRVKSLQNRNKSFVSGRPQYDYVYRRDGSQRIKHVLHKESLHEEFNQLMKNYSWVLRYFSTTVNKRIERNVSISDLWIETVAMINDVYSQDFESFGYVIASVTSSARSAVGEYQLPPIQAAIAMVAPTAVIVTR